MKISIEELNRFVSRAESLRRIILLEYRAEMNECAPVLKASGGILDILENDSVRWWYNPVVDTIAAQYGDNLMKYPNSEKYYGRSINNSWLPVFNTNSGVLLR